jgi:hypothetical protein
MSLINLGTPADRRRLGRRAKWLAAASVSYNAIDAAVAISAAQRRTGKALGSNALVADGTQILLCTRGRMLCTQHSEREGVRLP